MPLTSGTSTLRQVNLASSVERIGRRKQPLAICFSATSRLDLLNLQMSYDGEETSKRPTEKLSLQSQMMNKSLCL